MQNLCNNSVFFPVFLPNSSKFSQDNQILKIMRTSFIWPMTLLVYFWLLCFWLLCFWLVCTLCAFLVYIYRMVYLQRKKKLYRSCVWEPVTASRPIRHPQNKRDIWYSDEECRRYDVPSCSAGAVLPVPGSVFNSNVAIERQQECQNVRDRACESYNSFLQVIRNKIRKVKTYPTITT